MQELINKLCKIVFRDGDRTRSIKGDVISIDDNFVTIRTLKQTVVIAMGSVLKISESGRNEA